MDNQSSLNDDIELVDMNEIIKCNVDSWDEICPDETLPVISQEIKLESYNFLGNRINYDEDCTFDDVSFHAPEHYFNTQSIPNFELEEDDDEITPAQIVQRPRHNGVGVINLTDENSDDDDVIIVNTSDHNYSSQEVCIGSNESSVLISIDEENQKTTEASRSEHHEKSDDKVETVDPEPAVTEDQAAIQDKAAIVDEAATVDEAAATVDEAAATVNEAAATVDEAAANVDEVAIEDKAAAIEDKAAIEDQSVTEDKISKEAEAQESDSSVSDSNYIMSEGHSGPLEYQTQTNEKTQHKDTIGDTDISTEGDLNIAIGNGTSDQHNANKDVDACEEVTSTENLSTEAETENTEMVHQSAQENSTTIDEISNVNVSVELSKSIMNEHENIRSFVERVSLELTSFSELFANNKVTEENLKKHSTALNNTGLELTKSIKAISNIVDAEIKKIVAEDKARKLNDKSKKRWLASSSDDISHSEESASESPIVRRKKRRPRVLSTLQSDKEDEDVPVKTNKRSANVLLDDSNSESDRSSTDEGDLNTKKSTIEQDDDVSCTNAVEKTDDIVAESLEVKEDLISETICHEQNPVEANIDGRDVDMSKYFLPREETDVCKEKISNDDLIESMDLSQDAIHSDLDVATNDEIAQNSIESDVEMEEFLGFDDINPSVSELSGDINPSALNDDINQEANDQIESVDKIFDVAQRSTESDITEEDDKSDNEIVESEKEFVESQEWDLNDDPVAQNVDANSKENDEIQDEQQPCKENENDADDEKEEDKYMDSEDDDDYDSDKEIDRLVDLSTIPTKSRPIVNYVPVYKKKSSSKPKLKEDILDIIKDSTSQELDSESSEGEEIMSEEQYVLQLAKQRLMESSDEESTDNIDSDSEDVDGRSSINQTDESNDSKLNIFLKKRLVNEINDQFETEIEKKSSHNDLVNEADVLPEPEAQGEEMTVRPASDASETDITSFEPETVAEPKLPEDTTEETPDEPELELQSSGIFEPEIELRDGDSLSEKNDKSDVEKENEDDISQDVKSESSKTEEKKKWKLDKIAFNKNLFNDLDDEKQTDPHVINSDNSDCEMLDVSMFKTKNTAGDLDKIIQNQKKRDVTKSTKLADECISLSSDSDLEIDKAIIDDDSEDEKTTTKSRPMLRNDQLAGETKQAQKEENERLKRLEKKIERLTQVVETQSEQLTQSHGDSNVILDFDTKRNCAISVHPEIVKNLKEHQIAGVKFMYDCCYGSVDSIDKHVGSGCILAHCMGLGKTLQLIALLHTLIRYPQLKTKKILVICPKSTIMNWADEISTWLKSVKVKLKVLHFPDPSDINKKFQILREWHSFKSDPEGRAGCLLIGYEAFRSLVFYYKKPKPEISPATLDRIRKQVEEYLLKPGADLVVCNEGHVIKNRKSTTSLAVTQIKSRRRIILTGTPIQNNLKEYYSMVNFIKPSFLGTEKEFANLYENPIKEGQHKDSDKQQIRTMKQRSYVLHKKLSKFVQRREAALLKTFLPEKYEYVLFIPMTELQYFLDNNPLKEKYGGKSLIPDYTFLRKIWTHPKVLENAWKNAIALRDKRIAARKRNMDGSDEEPDDVLDNQIGKMSVENDWWRQFIEPQDLRSLLPSNKLRILFEILKLCQQNGEKCLIFSAFVAVLDVVEFFMKQINNKNPFTSESSELGLDNFYGPWEANKDYYRLDGKTTKSIRHLMIHSFNDPANKRVKCFLISAKAGGQGINLTGANRVILLDTSWNPSNDQQNIFRVFRLGQQKKCYIYRLLAMGTMEEKVYSRSVTKQAMSFRVVDEQQIDRHYSMAELAELYTLTIPDPANQPSPIRPADNVLANLLRNCNNLVLKYHEHDTLLENNSAEDLNEQEKADAWAAYENDVSMKNQFGNSNMNINGMYNNPYGLHLGMNNMMNPYSFMPSNLPNDMINSYLQRYQSGVEQELLMMSQMYQHYNPAGGPTSYGALGTVFNPPPSGSTNPLFNSPSSSNSNYFKSNISPITTSSASAYTNNMTTAMSPSVFNGINALSTSPTSQNMIYNLSRLMQSSSSTSRPTSSSIATPYPPSYNLYGSSANTTALNNAQPTTQPGPNAIKNPLLSNLLPPPASNTKDPFSIPTSVITKASKDHHDGRLVPRLDLLNTTNHAPVSLSPNQSHGNRSSSSTNAVNQFQSSNRPSSAHSNQSNSPSLTMTKSVTTTRASPSPSINNPSTARSSPSAARSSPSAARSSPSAANTNPSIQRVQKNLPHQQQPQTPQQHQRQTSQQQQQRQTQQQQTQQQQTQQQQTQQQQTQQQQQLTKPLPYSITPKSITVPGNPSSPETNIIVKDVTSINRSVERKVPTTSTPKTSAQIKNFNMGIVYPKPVEKKSFDLSQNDKLLRAAQDQLNSLRSNAAAQNGSTKSGISLQQVSGRPMNRPNITSMNRTNDSRNAIRMIDKNVTSSAQPSTKGSLASTLPTNEVTITPTRRIQKVVTPATTVGQQKSTSTMSITPSTTPSMSRKPSDEVNKSNNLSLSTLSTVSRLPASTSITRQTTMPTISGSANTTTGRVPNNLSSVNAKIAKQMPVLSRQGSLPTLKVTSKPSVNQNNNTKPTLVRTTNPVKSVSIAGNVPKQISRVVTNSTNQNGITKSSIRPSNIGVRKTVSVGSIPKLVNFQTSSTKRKLEDMIPLSSGVTLTKKPRTENSVQKADSAGIKRNSSFSGLPVQPKNNSSRPKESQSSVEIVELD